MTVFAFVVKEEIDIFAARSVGRGSVDGVIIRVLDLYGNEKPVWVTHGRKDGTLAMKPPRNMPILCCYPARNGGIGDWNERTTASFWTEQRTMVFGPASAMDSAKLNRKVVSRARLAALALLAEGGEG